jgi:hypothetical protein
MGAVLTPGLRNLQRQLDVAFPDRAGPDGWIGDAAHRARTSGHNPDDTEGSRPAWDGDPDRTPEARALDAAADLGEGADPQDVVDHIRRLPGLSAVLRYMIFDGHIYHVRNGYAPERHTGDPHTEHIHFEGAWTQAADNNETFNYRLERIPVALTPEDKQWIEKKIREVVTGDADPGPREYSLGGLITTIERRTEDDDRRFDDLAAQLRRIEAKLPA